MLVVCERWIGDGDRLLRIDPSSSDHSSTSFSSRLGLLNRGSLRAQSPLSAAGSPLGILSPTDSNCPEPPRVPSYIIISRSSASTVLPLIYTDASLDWRLCLGSICYIPTHRKKRRRTVHINKKRKYDGDIEIQGIGMATISHPVRFDLPPPHKVWFSSFLMFVNFSTNFDSAIWWSKLPESSLLK